MKKKLLIAVPLIVLLVSGVGYKLVLGKKPAGPPPKLNGALVKLADDFVVNLAGGHYGKISVALLVEGAPVANADGTAGTLPEEAAIRAIVTDDLTGVSTSTLIDRAARHELVTRLQSHINKQTDEKVVRVLLTDIAVE